MKKLLLTLITIASASIFAGHASAQLIIANSSVKASAVSKSELKDIFTGSSSSLDGGHVVPVLLKSGATQDEFLAAYIGKPNAAFLASWRNLVFSGQATMPKEVEDDAAVVAFVARTPGAIGFVGKAAAHEGVKVLAIK